MDNSEERYDSIAEHINKHKIKTACDGVDSRLCLAFGTFSQEIKSYFAGFNNFKYATAVRLIGKKSENGFVNEIEYEREGLHTDSRRDPSEADTSETATYKSYAILKSTQNVFADNLMYEYRVGQYINKFNRIYPCFLETYGLLKYNTDEAWENLKSENGEEDPHNRAEFLNGLAIQPLDYLAACRDSRNLAILIQHFNNFTALGDIVRDDDFIKKDLMYVLFQLYIPLAQMKDTFTHYDLHLKNLYLYEPAPGKYIQYHYHLVLDMAPVSFKSKYMLKIIDYGSSYFKDTTEEEDSQTLINKICKNNQTICDEDVCGQNVGNNKHIKKNQSIDLKALFDINKKVIDKTKLLPKQLHIILDKVNEYTGKKKPYDNEEMSYADLLYPVNSNRGGTKKMRRTRIRRAKSPKTTKKKRRTRIRRTKSLKTTKKMRRTRVGGANPSEVENYFAEKIHTVQDAANHLVWNVIKKELKEKNNNDYKNDDKDKDDEDKEKKKLGDLHVYLDGRDMVFDMYVKKDKSP